ncbi:MAG: 1-carboxybiuret hydrolase [Actinomycetota bacterium]|jgi:aspartyl-tRNA(Asn)/glutamyl-tRNA(Gln) amidotransferase subunit A|nr:1-carboxybiuret hydrolase [Actinomycetota bacterium]
MRLAVDAPSATELAAAVRAGDRSSVELVQLALARWEATEPFLAAFSAAAPDRALAEARALDDDAAHGRWRGPLHGVPIAVKDLFDVRGDVTLAGSRVPPTSRAAEQDADAVAGLRAAGAVVLGRTRTHEYAWGLTTQYPGRVGTRNPHDTQRVPGGSSGGSAAAVAAGVVPLALGTDTGASIRLPAAWCGVVGYKPTHGRVSLSGVVPLAPSFDHVGPIVRTVADARLAVGVLIGRPLAEGRYARDLRGLRVGLVIDPSRPVIDGAVADVLATTLQRLVDAGAEALDVTGPTWPTMRDTYYALQSGEALAYHRSTGHWPRDADLYGADVRGRLQRAEAFSDNDISRSRRALAGIRSHTRDVFVTVDVLLLPVAGSGPSSVSEPDTVRVNGRLADLREHVLPHTLLANLAGLPACAVPVGLDADGLPVGVQVVGPVGRDELVLDVAAAVAELVAARRPPAER